MLSVEEVADYLKLLGFIIKCYGDGFISISYEDSDAVIRIWNASPNVGLYIYGDGTVLLNALSKSYVVTPSIGASRFYDITNSNSRRSN